MEKKNQNQADTSRANQNGHLDLLTIETETEKETSVGMVLISRKTGGWMMLPGLSGSGEL
jgi:hypothetical protein